MQARRLTSTLACILVAGSVTGCGDTRIRIGKPPAFRSDRETQLIARAPAPEIPPAKPAPEAPTPIDRAPGLAAPLPEPPAPAPAAAAPLALAVAPGPGEGAGFSPSAPSAPVPPPAPVTRTLALGEALRLLADHHGVRLAHTLIGTPTVEVTGDPGPDLAANLRALLASVTPTYHTAIALSPDGLPAAVLVTPYPIVGAQ